MKSKDLNRNKAALIFYICVAALPVLQFLIFYVAIHVNSFVIAFQDYDKLTDTYSWNNFNNFKQNIRELGLSGSPLAVAMKNSGKMYLCSLLIGLTLALFFSYYIYKKMFLSDTFRVLLFLPSIISPIVMAIIFFYFTDMALPEYLGIEYGLFSISIDVEFNVMVFFTIWIGFGTQVLMYTGAMARISDSVMEYARLEGVSPFREFFQIIVPLIYPTITTFIVVGITGFFLEQANALAFNGAGADAGLTTIGFYIYKSVALDLTAIDGYPKLSALGMMFTFIAAPITLVVKWALEKFGPSVEL